MHVELKFGNSFALSSWITTFHADSDVDKCMFSLYQSLFVMWNKTSLYTSLFGNCCSALKNDQPTTNTRLKCLSIL